MFVYSLLSRVAKSWFVVGRIEKSQAKLSRVLSTLGPGPSPRRRLPANLGCILEHSRRCSRD